MVEILLYNVFELIIVFFSYAFLKLFKSFTNNLELIYSKVFQLNWNYIENN